jgi:hypothetical protein
LSQEKRLLHRWQQATNPPKVFVVCNKIDEVPRDLALIERAEAEDILRKYHPSCCKKPEDKRESMVADMLADLDADDIDDIARKYKPVDFSPIEEQILGTLCYIFPQDADRQHAIGTNIHFVQSDAALRAAQQGKEPTPVFRNMQEQLFRIIRTYVLRH